MQLEDRPSTSFLVPLPRERLLGQVGGIVAHCLEDPDRSGGYGTSKVRKAIDALATYEQGEKDAGSRKYNEAKYYLTNRYGGNGLGLDISDQGDRKVLFLVIQGVYSIIDYLNSQSTNKGESHSSCGVRMNQCVGQMVEVCKKELGKKDEDVWKIFDAIFDNQRILAAFRKIGLTSRINGLEAEVGTWLYYFGKGKDVRFAQKEDDEAHKIDIVVVKELEDGRPSIEYVQVKATTLETNPVEFDLSTDDGIQGLEKRIETRLSKQPDLSKEAKRNMKVLIEAVKTIKKMDKIKTRAHVPKYMFYPVRKEKLQMRK